MELCGSQLEALSKLIAALDELAQLGIEPESEDPIVLLAYQQDKKKIHVDHIGSSVVVN